MWRRAEAEDARRLSDDAAPLVHPIQQDEDFSFKPELSLPTKLLPAATHDELPHPSGHARSWRWALCSLCVREARSLPFCFDCNQGLTLNMPDFHSNISSNPRENQSSPEVMTVYTVIQFMIICLVGVLMPRLVCFAPGVLQIFLSKEPIP